MEWILVFLGGGLGSMARFGISKAVQSRYININPEATFISNMLSILVFAAILLIFSKSAISNNRLHTFAIIGFCGGFSTFSTFSFEIFSLLKNHFYWAAGLNIALSLIMGVGVFFLISKYTGA